MKQLISLIIILRSSVMLGSIFPKSEASGNIIGTVIDQKTNETIPFVTIVVKDKADAIIAGGITNEIGEFKIDEISFGFYNVTIQYIGYKAYQVSVEIGKNARKIDLGRIGLEEETTSLDEVVVVGENSTIVQKVDRKVITIGKDLATSAPTASEIMNNLPSVSVDQQSGEIALRGNENVRVMVDGKLSNVPAAQLLNQIPSTSIKQVELITNPSAKYNPEGMSGIINIVLHKNTLMGFNGSVNLGYTYEIKSKYILGLNMNYRTGKFNFYSNWGGNFSKNISGGDLYRQEGQIFQDLSFLKDSNSNLVKLGIDVYLNKKHTLSIFTNQNSFNGGLLSSTDITYLATSEFNQSQFFDTDTDNLSSRYNLDYKLDFDKEGHNIELEVDYDTYNQEEDTRFEFTGVSLIDDYGDFIKTERNRTTVNLDYINPYDESSTFEAGLQARLFESEISYSSTGSTFNSNGDIVRTPSTVFDYKRDIYSAYLSYFKKVGKWSAKLGVRTEMVEVLADTNSVAAFTNDYVEVYPSAHITYSSSDKNQYQISYSRRVDRPGMNQVNPIRQWSTPLFSTMGNTQLEPQFTNSVEVNYTRKLEKGSITTGVFYRAINNEINRAIFVDRNQQNKQIITYDNFEDTNAYGFELTGSYKPLKWWSFNSSFDVFSQVQSGVSESLADTGDIITEKIEVDNVSWNFRVNNNFKVTKKLKLSAFALYRGRNKGLQFDVEPMFSMNLGARYSFAQNNATLSINYKDIFNTLKFAFRSERPYAETGEFNWESNTIYVGISYNFGNGKYKAKSRRRRDFNEKSGGGVF
ncbi:outer membrane beta-barrel family protein [Aquimarina pacifica]|uniref:outer membrane beta-barrel family protein n=1 Tax=Aquimarina pacifica TaxID=1296415 RepID=UPI000471B282|nr:outer membrane beta-barrel family protein [Aquimarina pacifica]